jgi:hypothetical protein
MLYVDENTFNIDIYSAELAFHSTLSVFKSENVLKNI